MQNKILLEVKQLINKKIIKYGLPISLAADAGLTYLAYKGLVGSGNEESKNTALKAAAIAAGGTGLGAAGYYIHKKRSPPKGTS